MLTKKGVPVPGTMLDGIILYAPAVDSGYPLMAHVLVLKVMPTGSGGAMLQEDMALVLVELHEKAFAVGGISIVYVADDPPA